MGDINLGLLDIWFSQIKYGLWDGIEEVALLLADVVRRTLFVTVDLQ